MSKRLAILGSGIKAISHFTHEFITFSTSADRVLYLLNEPIVSEWIEDNCKSTFDLSTIYFSANDRKDAYTKISEKIIMDLSVYDFVAVILYGHPTMYAEPGLMALREAQKNGVNVIIIPAISSVDSLFSDLCIDPSLHGMMQLDATEFLIYEKNLNTSMHIVMWQIGMVGEQGLPGKSIDRKNFMILKSALECYYPSNFEVILYEASLYIGVDKKITKIKIKDLEKAVISPLTTLYIPPLEEKKINLEMVNQLGLDIDNL